MEPKPLVAAGPLDVVDVMRIERARFVDLLRSIDGDDLGRATECPAYDVKGIAAHILGDDFSLLSRQRDGAEPGVFRDLADGGSFGQALDRFNDRWVDTVKFFSAPVLIDLLVLAGEWTAAWYSTVDGDALGEPVFFFGATGPSPHWQAAAREYVERWVHHHQILRALGRIGLDDDEVLLPAAEVVTRGLTAHLGDIGVSEGGRVVLSLERGPAWTLERAGDHWELFHGAGDGAAVTLTFARSNAAALWSRGLPAAEVADHISAEGDPDAGARALELIAAVAGRH